MLSGPRHSSTRMLPRPDSTFVTVEQTLYDDDGYVAPRELVVAQPGRGSHF